MSPTQTTTRPTSVNFAFLVAHDRLLDQLGALAERYFAHDPSTSLLKLRQFGEVLAQRTAARTGLYASTDENQAELLVRLRDRGYLPREIAGLFHGLRKAGSAAMHEIRGDHREALHQLRMAWQLGVWFHRTFQDRRFEPSAFVPPPDPKGESALSVEVQHLGAETSARAGERVLWGALAAEAGKEQTRLAGELAALQAAALASPPAAGAAIAEQAASAAEALDLDEADTRRIIDAQLQAVGWEVDSVERTHAKGARPQKGKNLAIAEWPTETGPADYVLFVGLRPVAVVEAKRQRKDVSSSLEQAKRYSRGYTVGADQLAPGGPWGNYMIPFLFAANGRPFLRQLATKSGIWFLDARRSDNLSRPRDGWCSPDTLLAMLAQDIDEAHAKLEVEPTEYLGLRDYQVAAIRAIEAAIADGRRECLLAMATGTGKTRTCIGLTYRLLKTRRFRRVLFLVDRSALGEQTASAFKEARLENLQTFADIFDLKELGDTKPDPDTKLHIATIQGMVKRISFARTDEDILPVDEYDCIIVDECHRGYLLDRELGDAEFAFRDETDYISKYRRVLDHFDAVKIGLTATPALQTTEIFGRPVFRYSYREAVIDGTLIDHEPPIQIVTKLAEEGMHWAAGEQMAVYDTRALTLDTVTLPDEVDLDIDDYNRRVVTENFNEVVCAQLAKHIDPSLAGKTLIFCATDGHADLVVRLLKQALQDRYGGVEDDAVLKITGASDKPLQLVRRFKNERNPSIAVTVDLLTTGIDVPAICNLVFLRRVRSRILYEQMLGRATRRCDEIDKEVFRVFDAVDLYSAIEPHSTMKPVVADPNISFAQLIEELAAAKAPSVARLILDQLVAKLQSRHRRVAGATGDQFEAVAGLSPSALLDQLRHATPEEATQWFAAHRSVAELLDRSGSRPARLIISHHEDQLRRVERGYGKGAKPKDYLDSFVGYLHDNLNTVPALLVVTQRPRELTRAQLKQLRLALDEAGYTETALQTAWREMTNQDIAASIIGFVRRAALGDALIPYTERVDRAIKAILADHAWTDPQRKWLERIGSVLRVEFIVDREALDRGQFKTQGGFKHINKVFDGKLEAVLGDLHEALWQSAS